MLVLLLLYIMCSCMLIIGSMRHYSSEKYASISDHKEVPANGGMLKWTKTGTKAQNQIFIVLAILRRSVWRVAGAIYEAYCLNNTTSKKRRNGGEQLAILRPIWPAKESNPHLPHRRRCA